MSTTTEPAVLAGHAAAPNGATAKRRVMPVRAARLTFDDLSDGIYADWWADVRLNIKERDLQAWARSQDTDETLVAFLPMLRGWNFVDEAGDELPLSVEGLLDLPDDLLAALVDRWRAAFNEASGLPKASPTNSTPT